MALRELDVATGCARESEVIVEDSGSDSDSDSWTSDSEWLQITFVRQPKDLGNERPLQRMDSDAPGTYP